MQIKMVGIGKCGIRVAYDLFAYTSGLPSAYEIRLTVAPANESAGLAGFGLSGEAIRRRMDPLRAAISKLVREFNGLYRIAETPFYVTIDSDSQNNEIVNNVFLVTGSGEDDASTKAHKFPGENFDLNDHTGGCNFHIVSEFLARSWSEIPAGIVGSDGVSIYVSSFSIAGGTGGGSAAIICSKSRGVRAEEGPCHYMGLGVLPKSDERYVEADVALTMSDYEKFNSGRFFASVYGRRVPDGMNSVWLFSNDVLRFLIADDKEGELVKSVGGEMKLNLSLVNIFVAQALTVLANSSSRLTSADTNLDPRELNDYLDGKPFISGLARQATEDAYSDMQHQVLAVKRLLLHALTNVKIREGRLEGLSVPVPDRDLEELKTLLDDSSSNYDEFMMGIEGYDVDSGPIEFQTTYRLVVLYGQPEKRASERKKEMISKVCERVFPNSQKLDFYFRHHAPTETLLILLVDPFVRPIVSAMYYYANNAWSKSRENLREAFDSAIAGNEFKAPTLKKLFSEEELISKDIYGGGVEDISDRIKENGDVAINQEKMADAFAHLHEIYHRERPPTDTSSRLGRRRSSNSASKKRARSRSGAASSTVVPKRSSKVSTRMTSPKK